MRTPRECFSIFISYRHEDAGEDARDLADALRKIETRFKYNPFMDVEGISGGSDWREAIKRTLESTDALVALIGRNWLAARDEYGRRRIDDPEDWVRYEIRGALERGTVLIPCLGPDVSMPPKQALPNDIAGIADRQAIPFRDNWNATASSIAAALVVHYATGGIDAR
jgi:hypothetical protein